MRTALVRAASHWDIPCRRWAHATILVRKAPEMPRASNDCSGSRGDDGHHASRAPSSARVRSAGPQDPAVRLAAMVPGTVVADGHASTWHMSGSGYHGAGRRSRCTTAHPSQRMATLLSALRRASSAAFSSHNLVTPPFAQAPFGSRCALVAPRPRHAAAHVVLRQVDVA
jgi:hypothetical protein